MYPIDYYEKGKWTDRSWTTYKIRDLPLAYLWNIMFYITDNLGVIEEDIRFWKAKRLEILKEIDNRSKKREVSLAPFKRVEVK